MTNPLDFRYTSAVENAVQSTPENSIGGFQSTNSVFDSSTTADTVAVDAELVDVASASAATAMAGVGTGVLNVSRVSGLERLSITSTVIPSVQQPQDNGDKVWYLDPDRLFGNELDSGNRTQYRCIAIVNTSGETLEDVGIVSVTDNDSDCTVDFGIEAASHDYFVGTVSSAATELTFTDLNTAGLYPDDYFTGSLLRIVTGACAGQTAVIASFDGSEGTYVLRTSVGLTSAGDSYEIEPSPSQTVADGSTPPGIMTGMFMGFIGDGGPSSLSSGTIRESGGTLRPNDLFYVWVKRTRAKNAKPKSDSAAMLVVKYRVIGS